ncbi:hypothetical protein DMH04_24315 [Kibdelosporangium aridum]|uniref:Wadjet protein JetD C-terminal domain-containing protein n=1 Tax=Kibdelosporangium aridum TaxID=2030 RepID=A0A428Z6E1_KIBAR|nr:hypothetical protein [Kibdelosporangium aridum]RSM82751.1 hypothetical protein DMH04_24315 [Kibdelosporangium aridum]
MTTVDLDLLITELDPNQRGGRRHVDDIATKIRALLPHVESSEVPELVLDTIRRGEDKGLWSAARTTTVLRGRTTLPKSVTLLGRAQATDKLKVIREPLRREIAGWAANLPLTSTQREILLKVNDWLRRTNGGKVPMAAAAERAYEILHDEKAFDPTPPRGGATLWRHDRLTFDLLRCHRITTPLTWEPATSLVGEPGPIVCVENHATFRTLLRILRTMHRPPWIAVAWVQGRNTAPLQSLLDLPFRVTRLDYLGDLDAAGLEIAIAACATAETAGIPAEPAAQLWELLIEQPPRQRRMVDSSRANVLVNWLPESTRSAAAKLLINGLAIPQEALRYDLLAPIFTTADRGSEANQHR